MRYLKLEFTLELTWDSSTIISAVPDWDGAKINTHPMSLTQRQVQFYVTLPFPALCYRLYAQWYPNPQCLSVFTTVGNIITYMRDNSMSPSVNFTQPTENHYLQKTVTANTSTTYGWISQYNAYAQQCQHNFNLSSGADTNGAYTKIKYMPMYRFADDDPNYDILLNLAPDKVEPVPADWEPSAEPEPPFGNKSVYVYTNGNWEKSKSIYKRVNGAWTAGSSTVPVLQLHERVNSQWRDKT